MRAILLLFFWSLVYLLSAVDAFNLKKTPLTSVRAGFGSNFKECSRVQALLPLNPIGAQVALSILGPSASGVLEERVWCKLWVRRSVALAAFSAFRMASTPLR